MSKKPKQKHRTKWFVLCFVLAYSKTVHNRTGVVLVVLVLVFVVLGVVLVVVDVVASHYFY